VRCVPVRRNHRGQSRSLAVNVSADRQVSQSAGNGATAPLTSQADSPRSARFGYRQSACRWNVGGLPEPSVGVCTPAGTCPGRFQRHCVIGYADPGQNPSAVGFGSSRVQGGIWAGPAAVPSQVEGPMLATRTRASGCPVSCAAGSHAGSHADERPSSSPDSREQRAAARQRSRTDLNGSGCPYG
jgi:hypothetical protein